MNRDPLIDDIREIRHRISAECGHDPRKIVAYYMELQKRHQAQIDRFLKLKQLSEVEETELSDNFVTSNQIPL